MGLEIKGLANLAALVPGFAQGHAQSVEQRQRQQQIDQQGMAFEERRSALAQRQQMDALQLEVAGMELEDMRRRRAQSADASARMEALLSGGGGMGGEMGAPLGPGMAGPELDRPMGPVTPAMVSGMPLTPGKNWTPASWKPEAQRLMALMSPEDQQRFAVELAIQDQQLRQEAEFNLMQSAIRRTQIAIESGALMMPPEQLEIFQAEFMAEQSGAFGAQPGTAYKKLGEAVEAAQKDTRRETALQQIEGATAAIIADPKRSTEVLEQLQELEKTALGGNLSLEEAEFLASKATVLAGQDGPAAARVFKYEEQMRQRREALAQMEAMQQGGGVAGTRRPLQALQPPEIGGLKQALGAAEGPEDIAAIEQRYNVELTMQDIEALMASQAQAPQGGGGLSPFSDKPERLSKKPKGSSQAIPVPQDAAEKRRFLEELERSGGALAPPIDPMEQYRHLLPR